MVPSDVETSSRLQRNDLMAAPDRLAIAGRETRHEPATRPPRWGRGAMDWDDVRVFLAVARREADMALRHQPPESGDFYISKAGTFACSVYRRRGADAAAWVTYTDEQAHYAPARWVQRQVEETGKPVALRASSMLMHLEAIRAGTGRGVLPCYVGDGHPLLERLTPPIPEIAAEYWIIVHRDLRRAACVRAVIDWMKALFAEQRDVLAGAP